MGKSQKKEPVTRASEREGKNQIARLIIDQCVSVCGNVTSQSKSGRIKGKREREKKTYVFLLFIERIKIKVNLINFSVVLDVFRRSVWSIIFVSHPFDHVKHAHRFSIVLPILSKCARGKYSFLASVRSSLIRTIFAIFSLSLSPLSFRIYSYCFSVLPVLFGP